MGEPNREIFWLAACAHTPYMYSGAESQWLTPQLLVSMVLNNSYLCWAQLRRNLDRTLARVWHLIVTAKTYWLMRQPSRRHLRRRKELLFLSHTLNSLGKWYWEIRWWVRNWINLGFYGERLYLSPNCLKALIYSYGCLYASAAKKKVTRTGSVSAERRTILREWWSEGQRSKPRIHM